MGAPTTRSGVKKTVLVLGIAIFILAVLDMARAPKDQVTAGILLGGISLYQKHLSPIVPSRCHFTPTCSVYARMAIEKYGAFKGTGLAVWRILRCSPFTKTRGEDYP